MAPRWFALVPLLAATALAQDPAKLSADYKVEIENQWVRVLRVKHPPYVKIPMHEHPAAVAVFLTDVNEKITMPDGSTRGLIRKAGEVGFNAASKHAEENVGGPIEAVIVELKPGPPKSPPISLDPAKMDPEHHVILLENDRVRVLRTILEPHLKSEMHEHPHYVVVYLTESHPAMKLGDGRVIDNIRKPGDLAWRDALKHETEQMSDKASAEIQIEIK